MCLTQDQAHDMRADGRVKANGKLLAIIIVSKDKLYVVDKVPTG